MLLRGSVLVHLDPRLDGVIIPPWLACQAQLVLHIGLDLPVPIQDLRVDDDGIYGTLSFNRAPFRCVAPWKAVFALAGEDGRGMVWTDDVPPEIAAEIQRQTRGLTPELESRFGKRPRHAGSSDAPRSDGLAGTTRPSLAPELAESARRSSVGELDRAGEPWRQLADRASPTPRAGGLRSHGARKQRRSARPLPPYLRVVK